MTELELRQKFVKIAESYLGCKESDGSHKKIIDLYNTIKPLPVGYKVSYTDAWCATYVSAMAQEAGLTSIVFPECGCERMLKLYSKAGRWMENDAYVPQPGDIIFYDWADNGVGDNQGYSDHVGIVVSVTNGKIKLIEGNASDSVKYTARDVNGKSIRGFGLPDFASKATPAPAPATQTSSVLGNIKTNLDLAEAAKAVVKNYKTLYVMGCFGAPMNTKNKTRYCNNHSYNKQSKRTAMIQAASADTFGFDCVCFIKGLLWGWKGNTNHVYGGASYKSNGVPDIGADSIINVCSDISTDFSKIEIGELCWMQGHVGIYIGDGLSVECTPSWTNNVQFTACNQNKSGYNRRNWTKHGKLPYISYVASNKEPEVVEKYTETDFIKDVQKILGVSITGTANEETFNKTVTLSEKINNTHALVKLVQKYLYALGYTEVGAADGEAGPLFTQAVNRYQKEKLGYQDGEIAAKGKTWQKLINFTPPKEEPKPVTPAPEKPKEEPKPVPTPEAPKQEAETKPATPVPGNKPSTPAEPEAPKLKIGDTVKLVAGARYANGKIPLSWVYSSKLYVRDFRENESAVISTQKTGPITGVVYLKDLVPYNSVYDVIVTANLLNVRHKPTTNSDIINQIKKNTRHTIYEEENGWGHILNSGWISLNYARKV